jgi:hypothetical protein
VSELEDFLERLESIALGGNCIWLDKEWEYGPRLVIDATFKPEDFWKLVKGE